jgi:hypothetical protein
MLKKLRAAAWTAATLLVAQWAMACPLCGDNLANDLYSGNPSQLGRGFFWSIILMIVLPFVMVGTVTFKIVRARKRALREREDAPGGLPEPQP